MRRFKNILVVCSGAPEDQGVLNRAADLAERNQARLTLIHVMTSMQSDLSRLFSGLPGQSGSALAQSVVAEQRARVQHVAMTLDGRQIPFEIVFGEGAGFIEIIDRVHSHNHDLVIKLAGGTGMSPLFLSQDMHLMRKCPCPVWVINGPEGGIPRRILAAVDPDPEDATRDKLTSRFGEFSDRMRVLHLKGLASDTIVDHANSDQSDLIIMGTLARTGVGGLFIGNTAEAVLSRAQCSVLTVKPEGFVSPVPRKDQL